jgi:hypothetical protein
VRALCLDAIEAEAVRPLPLSPAALKLAAKTTLVHEVFVSKIGCLGFHLCYSSAHRSKQLPRKILKKLRNGSENCATMQGFADRSKQRDLKLVLTDFVSVP